MMKARKTDRELFKGRVHGDSRGTDRSTAFLRHPRWFEPGLHGIGAILFALGVLAAPPGFAQTYEFRFWPADAAHADPRTVAIHDGPCGAVATARVVRMPEYASTEPLAP